MQLVIKAHLEEIEKNHGVQILFACESGSRAWGFPSPDSDYDVRFVYQHPLEWYLGIFEHRDVIELPINAELDISGFDLRKTLRLLTKHNSVLFEWMQSPIFYSKNEIFMTEFIEKASLWFSPIASMHHYLSSAKKYYEEIQEEQVKLKKIFYCLRCTLAASWISSYQTIPPMEIKKLLVILKDKTLLEHIFDLINIKAVHGESYIHPYDQKLQKYLKETIDTCDSKAPSLPGSKRNSEELNSFFSKRVLHGY